VFEYHWHLPRQQQAIASKFVELSFRGTVTDAGECRLGVALPLLMQM
jgi:hypothetical protein